MLSRKQAATALGISVRRMRDLELQGRIRPKIGKKGERRKFDELDVDRLARAKGLRPKITVAKPGETPSYFVDHEHAAIIFDKLDEGMKKIEIVRVVRVHPAVVEQIAELYEKMRRQQDVSVSIARCAKCKENPARFCGNCAGR